MTLDVAYLLEVLARNGVLGVITAYLLFRLREVQIAYHKEIRPALERNAEAVESLRAWLEGRIE